MRHWRNALQQIYEHHATRSIPGYGPQTDTEKALVDALKELEMQCKERLDLLEALRVSRHEDAQTDAGPKSSKSTDSMELLSKTKGSIGQGTIPAVTYSELSRPTGPSRPPLPVRSAPPTVPSASRSSDNLAQSSSNPYSQPPEFLANPEKPTRSVSPDKHTMRTTLRSTKMSDKVAAPSRKSPRPAGEGPSKAATLAWSARGARDKTPRPSTSETPPVAAYTSPRQAAEQMMKARYAQSQWDSQSRRLVTPRDGDITSNGTKQNSTRHSDEYPFPRPNILSVSAASSAASNAVHSDSNSTEQVSQRPERGLGPRSGRPRLPKDEPSQSSGTADDSGEPYERREISNGPVRRRVATRRGGAVSSVTKIDKDDSSRPRRSAKSRAPSTSSISGSESKKKTEKVAASGRKQKNKDNPNQTKQTKKTKRIQASSLSDSTEESPDASESENAVDAEWKKKKTAILKNLPPGVEESAAKQILNDIIVQGDEVRWGDIAGLEIAKNALRETVVYPFLRPDLFMGLREPARGMLLFGPPGTGKTMLARAVATESRSTFFSISASSLTSKYLGESEKLVRALFGLARCLAPSIIFVDEIDSLLSQRSGSGEHEATRRIKTEFLIQWSDLQRAAAGRETTERDKERGDANRVLVLAATNLPWAIDEAARRRFVRRQYIPLPEPATRETQLRTLLGQQKHSLSSADIERLVELTDGMLTLISRISISCQLTCAFRFLGIRHHSVGQRCRHGPSPVSWRSSAPHDNG